MLNQTKGVDYLPYPRAPSGEMTESSRLKETQFSNREKDQHSAVKTCWVMIVTATSKVHVCMKHARSSDSHGNSIRQGNFTTETPNLQGIHLGHQAAVPIQGIKALRHIKQYNAVYTFLQLGSLFALLT
jgi:hypothetical protein